MFILSIIDIAIYNKISKMAKVKFIIPLHWLENIQMLQKNGVGNTFFLHQKFQKIREVENVCAIM